MIQEETARPLRVMVVDDHEMVRLSLAVLLETVDGVEWVGEAGDGAQAIVRCAETDPDVILMDIVMPVMNGIDATREIRAAHPDVRVIMLTSFQNEAYAKQAREAGASSFLLKTASIDDLTDAIHNQ